MLFMDGRATPSPSPMTTLTASRAPRECAAAQGVRRVARDHTVIPVARTVLPP